MSAHPTRRALLISAGSAVVLAGVAALGVQEDVLPGRSTLYRALSLDGPVGTIPNVAAGPMESGSFESAARLGKTVNWSVSRPLGSRAKDALPVLIALHGFNGSHNSAFGHGLGLDRFLSQAVARGSAPFAIASVDGGNSYWHRRANGEDSSAMVRDEFLPLLSNRGLDVTKVGLLGWSMGGFGALHIASQLGSGRAAVVIAESPALWTSASRAPHGAFDSASDFDANTPFGRQSELDGIAARVDCGIGDGFYPTAQQYVRGFTTSPAGGFVAGGHDDSYWRRMAPAQLAFAAEHLS
jgi:enterochelin esterase-like enzyme